MAKVDNRPTAFFRYDIANERGIDDDFFPKLIVTLFSIERVTPCGYWIRPIKQREYKSLEDKNPREITTTSFPPQFKKQKWVHKTARKKYAYPTKEEAWEGFIARTCRRMGIIKWQYAFVLESWIKFCQESEGKLRHLDDDIYFKDVS